MNVLHMLDYFLEKFAVMVDEVIVDAEGLSKFEIGSVDLHTTIGGNAGSRRAAQIIRSHKGV